MPVYKCHVRGRSVSKKKVIVHCTYGGNDGTTEEEGGGQVPAGGEVGRKVVHIQSRLHRRRHSLQVRYVIYLLKQHFTAGEDDILFSLYQVR